MKAGTGWVGFPGTGRVLETQKDSGTPQSALQVQCLVSSVQPGSWALGIAACQDRLGVVSTEGCQGLSLGTGAKVTVFGDNKEVSPRGPRRGFCSQGFQVRLGVQDKRAGTPRTPHY